MLATSCLKISITESKVYIPDAAAMQVHDPLRNHHAEAATTTSLRSMVHKESEKNRKAQL